MPLRAYDDTGEVATIERERQHYVVFWKSGRAPERGFRYQIDAKTFVERLRHSHKITWSRIYPE